MFKNYIKIAWRNLWKDKLYAGINMLSLSIGIATCLLVFFYIQSQFSVDNYHEKGDRIYRTLGHYDSSPVFEAYWGPLTLNSDLDVIRSMPGVEDVASLADCNYYHRLFMDGESYPDVDTRCTDQGFLNMFSFDLLYGVHDGLLTRPNTAVITQTLSQKLFGDANPVGRELAYQVDNIGGESEETFFEITGVIEDVPGNSHFDFDLLISGVGGRAPGSYLLLEAGTDPNDVANRLLSRGDEVIGRSNILEVRLEPLSDIYFSEFGAERQGNMAYVKILIIIAIAILLIACANYTNLATARYTRRIREIGVRKASGAYKSQLSHQFLVETALQSVLSLPLSLLLVESALPSFNYLIMMDLDINWFQQGLPILFISGLIFFATLIGGLYPAVYLARFNPVNALRGQLKETFSKGTFNRALVVFQFSVAVVLIASIVVIWQQLQLIQEKDLGFEPENVLVIYNRDPALQLQTEVIKQEFMQVAGVESASASRGIPGLTSFYSVGRGLTPQGMGEDEMVSLTGPSIDENFIEVMGISLVAGQTIAAGFDVRNTGRWESLINETAVPILGFDSPEEAVGQEVSGQFITGVVRDFHFMSLHHEIEPLIMMQRQLNFPTDNQFITVRISEGVDRASVIASLERVWEELNTLSSFEYSMLTDELRFLYEEEYRTAMVAGSVSAMAILIAGLGLFGLATLVAQRRTKEIGIRKVMGATVANIMVLLNKDFLKLVTIGFLIATPIAWYAMNRWLEDFAYRIEIGPGVFVLAGTAAILIALATVSWQSIRAALANPATSLRTE